MRRLTLLLGMAAAGCNCGPPTPDNCKGRKAGDLVITEFLSDPSGVDTGSEWIEIFNTLGTSIELAGVNIYVTKTDGTGLKSHIIRTGKIEPRSYFVMADINTGALPQYVNYTYGPDLGSLANSEGIIGLKCGSAITFDTVQYSVTPQAGHARQLDAKETIDAMVNDDETKWCDSPAPMIGGTMNFGTPGAANYQCPLQVPPGNCLPAGTMATRPIRPPAPGQLFVTEVMADPKAAADTDGEWIELHSTADVDLNDTVVTVNGTRRDITAPQCLTIPSGGYAILAHEVDPLVNGGLPPVLATFTASIGNSGGSIDITVGAKDAGVLIDTTNHPPAKSGIAWQLNPDLLDAVNNDDAGSYCAATVRFGADPDAGDFGTPAAPNTTCIPPPDPNVCNDNGTMRPVNRPAPGTLYVTEVMADPKILSDSVGEWIEVKSDNAADLNGVTLSVGASARTLSSFDCIKVAAGGYAVLGHVFPDAGALPDGGVTPYPPAVALFTQGLTNTGATLTLSTDAGIIDTTTYPAAVSGIAWQLSPTSLSAVGNDDPMNYCRATRGWPADGGDLGTPGDVNTMCPAPINPNECIDPLSAMTRPIVKPTLGQIVITEFMASPSVSDTTGEYIELLANASFDLNGLTLANEGTGMSAISSQACLPVTAGTYALFARSLDPNLNGGLPPPVASFSFPLANSGVRSVSVRSGATTLDTWAYTTTTSAASWQLKPGLTSPDDNEDAGSVCVTPTMRWMKPDGGSGDRGTPGAMNENCP